MKAFVTGATGFVGAHITRALLERGATVRCLARESSRLELLENSNTRVNRIIFDMY